MALSTGDYALLHPEDVTTLHNEFQYAQVVSVRQSAVTLRAVGHQPAQLFSTARDVAESRKVPVDEATGNRPGIWMRKAVAFTLRGYTYYGQVVGYDGNELLVQTLSGRKRVPADQVSGEVYPVVALVMGARRWSSRMWPQDRLEEVHDKIVDSILAGNDGAPIAPADLRGRVPQELPDVVDRQLEWVEPSSGRLRTMTLSYVLKHIFFVDGGVAPPPSETLGNSFCDEPRSAQGDGGAAREETGFFDPLVDDDQQAEAPAPGNDVRVHRVLGQGEPPSGRGAVSASGDTRETNSVHFADDAHDTMSRRTTASALEPEGGETQELELLELISRHKPHLLGYYIRQQGSDSALTKRIREPSVGRDDETASKRPRLAFSPSTEQERVHQALTAPIHKGKSSDAFIEFVLGMQQFVWHPGVLARVYDLQFGSRGLSITHFQRRGVMERYRASAQAASLSSDFSVPPPSAPLAKSWGELGAAARSFVAYAQLACDSATVTLAMTLNDFIADLEGREQFEEEDLAILVWWINDGLEKYRHAAAHDAGNGGTSRVKTIDRFSASNPELQGLALAILRERVVRDSEPCNRGTSLESVLAPIERYLRMSSTASRFQTTRKCVFTFCPSEGATQRIRRPAHSETASTSGPSRFLPRFETISLHLSAGCGHDSSLLLEDAQAKPARLG